LGRGSETAGWVLVFAVGADGSGEAVGIVGVVGSCRKLHEVAGG
jgi:hypothetical protein